MRESNPIPTTSGSRITRRVRLGLVEVALRTDEPGLFDYLADFYTITDEAVDGAAWTVDARLGDEAGMHRNPWCVAFDADEREKILRVRAESVLALAMTTRKALREGLVQPDAGPIEDRDVLGPRRLAPLAVGDHRPA